MPDAHYHALDTSRLRDYLDGLPIARERLGGTADYLNGLPIARERLGGTAQAWTIREVGDGNLNLVFIIEGGASGLVVKQALPYVRLVGELPFRRNMRRRSRRRSFTTTTTWRSSSWNTSRRTSPCARG